MTIIHVGILVLVTVWILMMLGFVLAFAGIAAAGGAGGGGFALGGGLISAVGAASRLVLFLVQMAIAYGWWVFTTPDPGGMAMGETHGARLTARVSALVLAGLITLQLPASLIVAFAPIPQPNTTPDALWIIAQVVSGLLGLAALGAFLALFFGGVLYIKQIAIQAADRKLLSMTRFRIWFIPVFSVVGLFLCYTGPLIGLVLYYNLLVKTRKTLREVGESIERGRVDAMTQSTGLSA